MMVVWDEGFMPMTINHTMSLAWKLAGLILVCGHYRGGMSATDACRRPRHVGDQCMSATEACRRDCKNAALSEARNAMITRWKLGSDAAEAHEMVQPTNTSTRQVVYSCRVLAFL
jgi:hypothetical protein